MNRLFFALLLAVQVLAGSTALAAEQVASKWRGYIVDRQCADSVREDTDPIPFLRRHSKDCSLMPSCKRDGYSLYADGKWLDVDKDANAIVMHAIKSSKRKNGFYAEVLGEQQGKGVKVKKITEIDEPAENKPGDEK
jgi:hypothetical protein